MRAGRPSIASASSSRCGPTVDTPRRTSASRASARATARPVRRHGGSYASVDRRRPRRRAGRRPRRRTGVIRSTSVARACPKRSPASASLASHTSSVAAAASSSRPPAWRSKRVALAHDAVELEAGGVVLHGQRHQRVVEEPPPIGRAALDQRQVVGREHRDAHDTEQVAGPPQALAVDLHPVAPGRHQLGLDQRRPTVVVADLGPHDRRVGADAHQRLGRCAAEAGQRGQVGQRLGEVRLALTVVADDDRRARRSARTTASA